MQPLELKPWSDALFAELVSWISGPEELLRFAGIEFSWPLEIGQFKTHFGNFPDREWYFGYDKDLPVAFGEIIPQEGNIPRLGRLIVNPTIRNQGIGRRLIKALEERCYERFNCPAIELFVITDNFQAIHCYRNYGFEILEGADVTVTHHNFTFTCHKMRAAINPKH